MDEILNPVPTIYESNNGKIEVAEIYDLLTYNFDTLIILIIRTITLKPLKFHNFFFNISLNEIDLLGSIFSITIQPLCICFTATPFNHNRKAPKVALP